jgi:hypothetical protein
MATAVTKLALAKSVGVMVEFLSQPRQRILLVLTETDQLILLVLHVTETETSLAASGLLRTATTTKITNTTR